MSKHMVRLTPWMRKSSPVDHPLLSNCAPPLSDEEIDSLVDLALDGDAEAREKLILGHLRLLSHTVGRYRYYWPLTRRLTDEMVSAGVLAMTKAITELTREDLDDKPLGIYLAQWIYKAIEIEVSTLRGVVPAPARTNQRRVEEGLNPIFGEVVSGLDNPAVEEQCYYMEAGFEMCDVLEAVSQLKGEFEQLDVIFDKQYWGLTDQELADLIGISRRTVSWYRTELLRRYRELTENET